MKRFLLFALIIVGSPGCSWLGGIASQVAGNFSAAVPPERRDPFPGTGASRLEVQWVGHSTMLIRVADRVIMLDPLFGSRVSAVKARLVEPGIDLDSIGRLDAILISHPHPDHLDPGSLSMLESRFPAAHLVFAAGLEEWLLSYAFPHDRLRPSPEVPGEVTGEAVEIGGVRITAVRTKHWAGRYGLDGLIWNMPGYTGYIIEYAGLTVFYPGDTGYDSTIFKEIGARWPIDLAILPIGPCGDDTTLGTPKHVNPAGALQILEDTRACMMVPVHYGTIHEPLDPLDPLEVLLRHLRRRPDLADRVVILQIGERTEIFR